METKNITRHSREERALKDCLRENPAETFGCHKTHISNTGSPRSRGGQRGFSGFTLVELIVVITILVILGTIAFVQLGNFAGSARDSARVSDMGSIMQGLELSQVKSGIYPVPDASDKGVITLTASGTTIGYQGYAGANVLSSIKMSDAKDPLDKKYYTYVTNANYSKYQILGLMEDSSTLALNDTFGITPVYAGYDARIPTTKGSTLGVLLGNAGGTLNMPVQENYSANSFTGVDILNTTGSYVMYMSKTQQFSGTGVALKAGIAGGGLVGYWSFDEGSGSVAYDRSGNGNNGVFSGGTLPSWTGGKLGDGLYLSGGYVNAGNNSSLQISTDVTASLWFKIPSSYSGTFIALGKYPMINTSCADGAGYLLGGSVGIQNSGFFGGRNCSGIYYSSKINKILNDNNWHFMTGIKQGTSWITYIDGEKAVGTSPTVGNINAFTQDLIIGKTSWGTYPMIGSLDEVRIYNRALSDSEIQTLYNATK